VINDPKQVLFCAVFICENAAGRAQELLHQAEIQKFFLQRVLPFGAISARIELAGYEHKKAAAMGVLLTRAAHAG